MNISLLVAPPLPKTESPSPVIEKDAPILAQTPQNAPMKLPPHWKSAKDSRGLVYYYHMKERKSQWSPPSWTEEQTKAEVDRALSLDDADEESSSESSVTDSDEEEEEDNNDSDILVSFSFSTVWPVEENEP